MERWQTDGKFFRAGKERAPVLCVTYGPFPGGWPESFDEDFSRIAAAGFNSVRVYTMPGIDLLDAAERHRLRVFGGLEWGQSMDFAKRPGLVSEAKMKLVESLGWIGDHPALAALYVGNEIPADLVRWIGAVRVRETIEELIRVGKETAPGLMFAYASYPSTEYLEPENADFTAFNIYLESEVDYRNYLQRLHHIAGDRPLVISEFGLDSRRNGLEKQAEVLRWAVRAADEEEAAGFTIYAWSDRWITGGQEVLDWDFGMVDRAGRAKLVLEGWDAEALKGQLLERACHVSVIVCTRNGRGRIATCLEAIGRMSGGNFETIVVDDGSVDGTADFVAEKFPGVRLIRSEPVGLSAARNTGAAVATGELLAFTDDDCEPDFEWVGRLRRVFQTGEYAAAGGPNLAPAPKSWQEAVVCAVPGAPSHVMLTDQEAEHLPGCNLAVTKVAFDAVGGFDSDFHTAGDDVDFCWRLRGARFRLGFAPGAFVWHRRRPTVAEFLRQQIGYGKAERLLMAKHPAKFSKSGGTRWEGFVYGGGPVRALEGSVIYHGPMGTAGYQRVMNRMLPLRGLNERFDSVKARWTREFVEFLQPRIRAWARNRGAFLIGPTKRPLAPQEEPTDEFSLQPHPGQDRAYFLQFLAGRGWRAAGDTNGWDVERNGTRLLVATEYRADNRPVIMFRVWGDAGQLRRYMSVERKRR